MRDGMWMIRAGEAGYLIDEFARGYVAIGWEDIGDLSSLETTETIRARYEEAYPGQKPGKVVNSVAVLHKFRTILKPGDRVLTYDPRKREYLVGSIIGDYDFDPGRITDSPHLRKVEWKGRVSRDVLSPSARNSLGSTLTLFFVPDDVSAELMGAISGGGPRQRLGVPTEGAEDLEDLKEETRGRAHELIKDKILSLDDRELEELLAAILRAMGYRAKVSPKGPDRGVDVIASPDGLGLDTPRIKVEVKHRPRTQMGAQQIRSFIGGLREGDRGLYVSTGGFSKDAKYEADRSTVPVTLVELDEMAHLVVTHYDHFDMDGRVLLPLVKVYWPAE